MKRFTYPALVTNVCGPLATDSEAHDVSGRVVELLGQGNQLLVTHLLGKCVHRHRADELSVADLLALRGHHELSFSVNLLDGALLAQKKLLLGESVCHSNPDTTGTSVGGEAECGVGAPVTGRLLKDHVLGHVLEIGSGDTLSEPGALHLAVLTGVAGGVGDV